MRLILPFLLLSIFCSACSTPVAVIKVPNDDGATLFPALTPVKPSKPIVHCYNSSLTQWSDLFLKEVAKRFRNPVVIDIHGGFYEDDWYACWDESIFGPQILVKSLAETYLRKYKDCDIIILACNSKHKELVLSVPPEEAHRVWYFTEKVWCVPDDDVPYWNAKAWPPLTFHETVVGKGSAGSIWEAVQARGMGEIRVGYNATQPTTKPSR
jgi:hypothetical protein